MMSLTRTSACLSRASGQAGNDRGHELTRFGGVVADLDPRRPQRIHLCLRRALTSRHDGARVAHLLARRCRDTRDVGHHRLVHLGADEFGRFFFGGPTDLADHHHSLGFGIVLEGLQAIDEGRARNRVATDADAGRDADALLLQLVERLVGQGARSAHDAYRAALLRDVARSDADVAFTGRDDARAVGAEQLHAGIVALELAEEPRFVMCGYAFGDHDDELDAAVGRLHDRIFDPRSRDEDARCSRARGLYGIGDRREDRNAFDFGTCLLGIGTGDDLGAVLAVQQAVVLALRAGESLVDDLCVLINEYRHFSNLSRSVQERALASATAVR